MLLLRVGGIALIINVCLATMSSWATLAQQYVGPYIAERDISTNNPIDQLTYFGVSLNRVIFDVVGYSNTSLPLFQSLLNLKYSLFMVDLYWNHFTQKWQLCPAPIPANQTLDLSHMVQVLWNNQVYQCLPGFAVSDVFQYLNTYLSSTNVRLLANMVQFAFNLKSIYHEERVVLSNSSFYGVNISSTPHDLVPDAYKSYGPEYLSIGNSTLKDSLHPVDPSLFTPLDLQLWNTQQNNAAGPWRYPTQDTYLFSLYKRVFPFVLSNQIHNSSTGYNISTADADTFFIPGQSSFEPWVESYGNKAFVQNISSMLNETHPSTYKSWAANTHFRLLVDDDTVPFTNETVSLYLRSGFSTILNSSNTLTKLNNQNAVFQVANNYTPVSFWSWAPGQFCGDQAVNLSTIHLKLDQNNDTWYVAANSHTAYLCVSVTRDGWALQNCYDKIRGVCQNNTNPYSWRLTDSIYSYLDWTNNLSCPQGYKVGVPHLSLEQFSLMSLLVTKNVLYPVWIDMNDITVPGCYVLGGPYALCPYQEAITTKNFFKSLAPSLLVALVLIVLIFCERFCVKTPIHTNRKRHWKRQIEEYYKDNDYEGVPL